MLISFNWLKDFVKLPSNITADDVSQKLTMHTLEVEGTQTLGQHLDDIVVGQVLEVQSHPNADQLKVVITKIAPQKHVEIVCGGINLVQNMKVAVALPGAKVRWHGEGDLVALKATKIRGVTSVGMICAASEIGLGEQFPTKEVREILDISFVGAEVGTPIKKALGLDDAVLEIDNKSITHRPDLWGHFGMAREVSAIYQKELSMPTSRALIGESEKRLSVSVRDTKLCPRYMAVRIDDIQIGPSPDFIKQRLLACGVRSINNIVDITNYVMLELGQPMHAFDAEKLNNTIIVRQARRGEKILALDEQEYALLANDLVIADEKGPIAIAGVMGGMDTAVSDTTTSIIFESANFDAASVRKTSARLGLRSESSARFEKSLDPTNCALALERAVALTLEVCPQAHITSNIADEKNFHLKRGPISVDKDFFEKRIGTKLTEKEVTSHLEQLGFDIKLSGGNFSITVPTWRATKDISIPEDLVEEVARMYGYEKIPNVLPKLSIDPPAQNTLRNIERKISDIFINGFGITETSNYSFVSAKDIENMGEGFTVSSHLELDNPISKKTPYLRRSLIPGLLNNIEKNLAFYSRVALFEMGAVFLKEESGQKESPKGKALPRQNRHAVIAYSAKGDTRPYQKSLAAINMVLKQLGYEFQIKEPSHEKKFLHPTRQAEVYVDGQSIGFLGEVHPAIAQNFGIGERVSVAEINLHTLVELPVRQRLYKPIQQFPPALRDVAFVVSEKESYKDIVNVLLKASRLVHSVELFDIYRGKSVGPNKKSMAFHIAYQASDHTLDAQEVDMAHKVVTDELKKKFSAKLR